MIKQTVQIQCLMDESNTILKNKESKYHIEVYPDGKKAELYLENENNNRVEYYGSYSYKSAINWLTAFREGLKTGLLV
jgi:hypothetical protein